RAVREEATTMSQACNVTFAAYQAQADSRKDFRTSSGARQPDSISGRVEQTCDRQHTLASGSACQSGKCVPPLARTSCNHKSHITRKLRHGAEGVPPPAPLWPRPPGPARHFTLSAASPLASGARGKKRTASTGTWMRAEPLFLC